MATGTGTRTTAGATTATGAAAGSRRGGAGAADTAGADRAADTNQVHLRGRVTSGPERRTLPSGDEVVQLRLTVRRPDRGSDTLDVSVGPGPAPGRRPRTGQVGRRLLAAAEALDLGARVELRGALRRRWWDAGGARHSRVEVTADGLERVPAPPVAGA